MSGGCRGGCPRGCSAIFPEYQNLVKATQIWKMPGKAQAAQAYSLYMYFVWNFGSERFIRLCMGI